MAAGSIAAGALEPVGVGRADDDEAGRPQDAVPSGQVAPCYRRSWGLGGLLGVIGLNQLLPPGGVGDVLVLLFLFLRLSREARSVRIGM